MKETIKMWATIIIVISIIIGLWVTVMKITPSRKTSNEIIIEKILQIESKIDSISSKKDSIRTIVITIEKEIEINSKKHEKTINTIINSNDSSNLIWIEDYIRQYKLQHSK